MFGGFRSQKRADDTGHEPEEQPRAEGEEAREEDREKKSDGEYSWSLWRDTGWDGVVFGWLAALGAGLILSGLLSGALAAGLDGGSRMAGPDVGRAGLMVTIFLSFLVGGYVAGKMTGRHGIRHGLLVPLLALAVTLLLMLFGLAVGASFLDNLGGITLPEVPRGAGRGLDSVFSPSGILALFCVPFLGGALGGAWGEKSGRRREKQKERSEKG